MLSSLFIWNISRYLDGSFLDSMARLDAAVQLIVTDDHKRFYAGEDDPAAGVVARTEPTAACCPSRVAKLRHVQCVLGAASIIYGCLGKKHVC